MSILRMYAERMLEYPSITSSNGQSFCEFKAHVFDKLDGSNLRFEWSRKRGWYKCGTRTRLFDESDKEFGPACQIFANDIMEGLTPFIRKQRIDGLQVFAEYWGAQSFAGVHAPGDAMKLSVFDLYIPKGGFLAPRDFLRATENIPTAAYLGEVNWTRDFVRRVKQGQVEGITFEGAVGKAAIRNALPIMAKAKQQIWIDKVRSLYGEHLPTGVDI